MCVHIDLYDLKVTGDHPREFQKIFFRFGYHIQAIMYMKALAQLYNIPESFIDTRFLVASVGHKPILWRVPTSMLHTGLYGATLSAGYKVRGLEQLVAQYYWHTNNQIFEYTQEEYEDQNYLNFIYK